MSALTELINQVEDKSLRERLQLEVNRLTKQKKFGLVFEEHIPECTPLYDVPVKKGSLVAIKGEEINHTYEVKSISDGIAVCYDKEEKKDVEIPVSFLICVAQFGDPIYPYLKPIDKVVNAPDSDLWHTLIEADNYHALQLLEYLYAGKVDCIYIDPPYNTGARDWKYNNDYVDNSDAYRHSKWLSFMEKRLKLAKKLLNPKDSVLIVTIDDKEYLHLGCLLEELFSEAKITMISSVINPVGKAKKGGTDFSRTDEYIFFLQFGNAAIQPEIRETSPAGIRWQTFRRSSLANGRGKHGVGACGPNQFYPIYIDDITHKVREVGYPIAENVDRFSVKQIEGCTAVFPVRKDGSEINWGSTRDKVLELLENGYFKVLPKKLDEPQQYKIKYLTSGVIRDIEEGKITITGKDETGCVVGYYDVGKELVPTTNWNKATHNATSNGTDLLTKMFIEPRFDYAKSLYAEHDAIRCAVANKPNALILDFFAGSGTTLHAVNLLNAEDGGHRRCIMVTNNEVSNEEAKRLRVQGYSPGDDEWEKLGIARYVTWPRTVCSIRGVNINSVQLDGEYISSATRTVSKKRRVQQIAFIDDFNVLSLTDKKKALSAITNNTLSGKDLGDNDEFIIAESTACNVSVLINVDSYEEWLEELQDMNHITELLVLTKDKKKFNNIKKAVEETLPQIKEQTPLSIPMSDGFKANCEYFKLGFLDKNEVALGRQLKELIPLLWMKAGAKNECPEISDNSIPDMLVYPKNNFAVLVNETEYMTFIEELEQHPEIEYVFFVTDSDAGYRDMISGLEDKNTYQLYRDYLDNFRINTVRR